MGVYWWNNENGPNEPGREYKISCNADQSLKKSGAEAVAESLTTELEMEDGIDKSMIKLLSKFIAGKVMNKIAPNIFKTLVSRASAALRAAKGAAEITSDAV